MRKYVPTWGDKDILPISVLLHQPLKKEVAHIIDPIPVIALNLDMGCGAGWLLQEHLLSNCVRLTCTNRKRSLAYASSGCYESHGTNRDRSAVERKLQQSLKKLLRKHIIQNAHTEAIGHSRLVKLPQVRL